jgi:beta-lactamase class A
MSLASRMALGVCLILVSDRCAWAADLESRVAPLVKAHKGKVAVAIKHLKTGVECYVDSDEVMPTASLIKLPIMVETYWQAGEGKIKLDTKLTLTKDDKVTGSGVLTQNFSDGATFALRDAMRLMIVYSDNTATNLVLDQIGIPSTNVRMDKLGLPNTRINAKVFKGSTTSIAPERTKKYGLGSTTARELVKLLELIDAGKVASPEACKEMVALLKKCEDKDSFRRYLPLAVEVAHKTGAVNEVRTDAGIMYLPSGPVAYCILTNKNEDQRWSADNAGQVIIAKIAREIYDQFDEKK